MNTDRRSFMKLLAATPLIGLAKPARAVKTAQTNGCAHKPKCTSLMDMIKKRRARDFERIRKEAENRYLSKDRMYEAGGMAEW